MASDPIEITISADRDEAASMTEGEVRELLAEAPESKEAVSAWNANWNREERQRSSIYTTAETIIEAFADPRVLEASRRAEYTPAALLDGGANTLFLAVQSMSRSACERSSPRWSPSSSPWSMRAQRRPASRSRRHF